MRTIVYVGTGTGVCTSKPASSKLVDLSSYSAVLTELPKPTTIIVARRYLWPPGRGDAVGPFHVHGPRAAVAYCVRHALSEGV